MLLEQNFGVHAVPASGPIFIGPAEAEGKIRFAALPNLVHGTFQDLMAVEPIVVIAKPVDSISGGHLCLCCADFGEAQVVKSQVRG